MQRETTSADLAALIGSRICHDLISPIGAIANGLELLSMSGGPTGPEMDLITDSADNAGARIGFFRIAYGAAGSQTLSSADVQAVLDAITAGGRLLVDWQISDAQPRGQVRLAFLALQCCESALPLGGTVTIGIDGDQQWCVAGHGGTINTPPELWDVLASGRAPEVTAATVQFALLADLIRQDDRALAVTCDDSTVAIRF